MANPQGEARGRADVACSFCAELLAADDRVASIRVLSHARDYRYFAAHVLCLQKVVQPDIAQSIDLADVPPGLDHFLALPA